MNFNSMHSGTVMQTGTRRWGNSLMAKNVSDDQLREYISGRWSRALGSISPALHGVHVGVLKCWRVRWANDVVSSGCVGLMLAAVPNQNSSTHVWSIEVEVRLRDYGFEGCACRIWGYFNLSVWIFVHVSAVSMVYTLILWTGNRLPSGK